MTEEKKMVVQGITFEPLMTPDQVCKIFKVSKGTLKRWRDKGKFPQPVLFGRQALRYRKADIEAFIANAK